MKEAYILKQQLEGQASNLTTLGVLGYFPEMEAGVYHLCTLPLLYSSLAVSGRKELLLYCYSNFGSSCLPLNYVALVAAGLMLEDPTEL